MLEDSIEDDDRSIDFQGCQEQHDPFSVPRPWTAFQSDDYGYTRMTVHNASHLYLEQVSDDQVKMSSMNSSLFLMIHLLEQGGKVVDSMWLIKSKHGPYSYFQ